MKTAYKALVAATAMTLISVASAARADDASAPTCNVDVNTDSGSGGTQLKQCGDSTSIGFSGPIKDVDVQHPFGKGDAFLPKAGRDIANIFGW